MATTNGDTTSSPNTPKTVLGTALQLFSRQPLTGFNRDGYCRVTAGDYGVHGVAGIVSEEFLDYTASQGNDLRVAGLTGGCKWCLCASRWQEAVDAFREGRVGRGAVPRVKLEATDQRVMGRLEMKDLEEFKAE